MASTPARRDQGKSERLDNTVHMSRKGDIEPLSVEDALKLKEGYVRRVFPGEYLQASVRDVMRDAAAGKARARTALKLLLANEYDKGK